MTCFVTAGKTITINVPDYRADQHAQRERRITLQVTKTRQTVFIRDAHPKDRQTLLRDYRENRPFR